MSFIGGRNTIIVVYRIRNTISENRINVLLVCVGDMSFSDVRNTHTHVKVHRLPPLLILLLLYSDVARCASMI